MLTSTRALSSHKWAGNFWFGNKRFLVFKLHSFNGFSRKRELNSAAKSFSNHTKQKAFCYPRPPFDSNRFVLFPNFASLQRRHVAGYRRCLYSFEFTYFENKVLFMTTREREETRGFPRIPQLCRSKETKIPSQQFF